MSVWVYSADGGAGFSDNTLFVAEPFDYFWLDSKSRDTKSSMKKYGWALIGPSTLSKWGS